MKEKLIYSLVLLPVIVVVLLLQTYKIEPFESFSLRFNDVNFDLQKKEPNKDIVFVAVDEPSVNKFGRWPWDRTILAKGVEALSQADVLMMDMIFSEPTNKKDDDALADSIANLNASVCGFFLRHEATQSITGEELDILSNSSLDLLQSQVSRRKNPSFIEAKHAEMNIATISNACSYSGSFTTLAEDDNLMRFYPIAVYYQDMLFPSLAIQALRLKFNSDVERVDETHVSFNGRLIGLDKRGFIRLNYYKKEQYNIVSFLDVVGKKVKPEYFKNKIVILGITEVGAGDVASTPIGSLYGPLLHYTFISNVLENHLIKEPPYISNLIVVLLALIPLVLALWIKKIVYRFILYVSMYFIVYGLVRYMFVSNMIYIDMFYPMLSIILSAVIIEVVAFNFQEKGSRFMRSAFSSYLSSDLLDQLIKNPNALTLGGEKKELSVLFSDIRGFTSISESMDPVSLINLLNRYFTPMTNAVLVHNGMLDKYIGDAVMAFFNAPVNVKDHADAACFAALEMIDRLETLNQELKRENINPIKIGIGINTAEVVVGNMGSDTRFNYTVIGDGVNLASRVEGLTKNYGVEILITEFTVAKLNEEFIHRKVEPVKVKGKDEAVLLYQLMPFTDMSRTIKNLYDEALEVYIRGDFKKAENLFGDLADEYDDMLSKYFLRQLKENASWGVHKMMTK